METTHQLSDTTQPAGTIAPAYLWIGQRTQLQVEAERYLQTLFCSTKNSCNVCPPCRQISQRQFHAISWWTPEKQYSVDDIDDLLARLRFANDPGSQFFFVLERADALPPACANRLLKSIEEPPTGYHFLLLAERRDMVLPTIRSRCIVRSWYADEEIGEHHQFIAEFTSKEQANPLVFLSALETAELNEHNSVAVLDAIMSYWVAELKQNNSRAHEVMAIVQHAYVVLPMPGSAKLFWKNLYLQLRRLD